MFKGAKYDPHEIELKNKLKARAEKDLDSYVHSAPFARNSNSDITEIKGKLKEIGIPEESTSMALSSIYETPFDSKINKSSNLIFHDTRSGYPGLAHEVGHSVSRLNPEMKTGEETLMKRINRGRELEASLGEVSKDSIKNKRNLAKIGKQAEQTASDNGLLELKNLGATRKELKRAKKVFKTAKKTYRGYDVGWKKDTAKYLKEKKKSGK